MLQTLGLFLSEEERKLSRLKCSFQCDEGEDGHSSSNKYSPDYEPDLYLQGFVVVRKVFYYWSHDFWPISCHSVENYVFNHLVFIKCAINR